MGPALRLLLDTSAVIWAAALPGELSPRAREELEAENNEIHVSAASAWEIATKLRLGRLHHAAALVEKWHSELARFGWEPLAITHHHALRAGRYDIAHADPFDRVIAAQAELEDLTLVAKDRAFDLFPVRRVW